MESCLGRERHLFRRRSQPKTHSQVTSGTGQPGQADCPEARRLRTKSCFGNGGKRGPRASSRTAAQVFDLILTRQQWAHSVLQRPQQASATRGLLAATGCAAGSFTQKAWQYAQNEPHLPVQSLWELKPDLSEIRGASNYWHVQTEPPPRWCLSCCVKSVVTCPFFPYSNKCVLLWGCEFVVV